MVDPFDVNSCYETIETVHKLYKSRIVTKDYYIQVRMVMMNIANKYMNTLTSATLSKDDVD